MTFLVLALLLQVPDPDSLYGDRANVASAVWEQRLASNPRDFESAWKLARACYWLGGHGVADARAARQAVLDAPFDLEWAPEDQDYKARASDLLRKTS